MKKTNYMRDLMLTGFELSRISGVPMLYLGNPGMGKTTIVNLWAKRNGYHVESLIGSAFDRSEVLGYMVNDGKETDYLRTKEPEWFHTIAELEKSGTHSVLFIDEIASAPKDVQASLYRLIFERTIGNGHKLPQSTIIASASNYKDNLPQMCDITAPNINRFCVVNFGPQTFEGLYREFLQEKSELEKDLPEFKNLELTDELREKTAKAVLEIFEKLNSTYNITDCSKGELDVKNKRLSNIFCADYSKNGEVYNFISGRTIGYFRDIFRAMYCTGLTKTGYIGKFVDGLVGLGFNSFDNVQELNAYRKFVKELTKDALSELLGKKKDNAESLPIDASANGDIANGDIANVNIANIDIANVSICEKVTALLALQDKVEYQNLEEAAAKIYLEIIEKFDTSTESLANTLFKNQKTEEELVKMRADYDAIEIFSLLVNDFSPSEEKDLALSKLYEILTTYRFYMHTCIQTEAA